MLTPKTFYKITLAIKIMEYLKKCFQIFFCGGSAIFLCESKTDNYLKTEWAVSMRAQIIRRKGEFKGDSTKAARTGGSHKPWNFPEGKYNFYLKFFSFTKYNSWFVFSR